MAKKRRTVKRKSSKSKLAGFTKTGGKFRLVFNRKGKLILGKGKFGSKKTLLAAASKKRR